MIRRLLRRYWLPITLLVAGIVFCVSHLLHHSSSTPQTKSLVKAYKEGDDWAAPSDSTIPSTEQGEQIRYGRELIAHTAKYLGPQGSVRQISNGMNCQNCHTFAGTQPFANPFSAVASTYPRYRDRSGRVESIEFRINDCLQRSLNGKSLDSQSHEMQAMVAYLKWVGNGVPKSVRPKGAGTQEPTLLDRPADPQRGKLVYINTCQRCHGKNGEGMKAANSTEYAYPPLWGESSFNTGAGIYRIGSLAGFVKNNMPYGTSWTNPQLTDEEAWDVAAFVVSQPRPMKKFPADWKNVSKKPFDYPFGPFADSFSEQQHKYGPFAAMKKKKGS